jgi:hypothetical protein
MLDSLLNFAAVDLAVMVIAAIVLVYVVVRVTSRVKDTSAQLDAHSEQELAAIDRDRAARQSANTNMHVSV